jgi:hypothetical protein
MNGRKVAFNWRLLYFSMYKVTNDKKKTYFSNRCSYLAVAYITKL